MSTEVARSLSTLLSSKIPVVTKASQFPQTLLVLLELIVREALWVSVLPTGLIT